jgi:NitT/TauT family transport system substrate-binding protein
MGRLATTFCLTAMAAATLASPVARCEETLRLAVGAPNNWDSGVPEIGRRAGIFGKHGLKLELLYTNGGGETLQAVISGSVDLGIGAGTGGVLGAFAKGAPVRILLAGTTGASDLYWYVPAGSPLKSFGELAARPWPIPPTALRPTSPCSRSSSTSTSPPVVSQFDCGSSGERFATFGCP